MLAVGLMSGTSLDGVDAALVDIDGTGSETTVRLVRFSTLPMPGDTKERILRACSPRESSSPLICSLSFELGRLFSQAVTAVCEQEGIATRDLAFVASHGQTVWHSPVPDPAVDCPVPSTLQIGEPAVIAWETGVPVVSNFRTVDVAAGGQGAPLVPFSEIVLYGDERRSVGLLNVGGIANLTVLPAGCAGSEPSLASDVFAFDTGPGNMMVDEACRELLGVEYDEGGRVAASGRVIEPLLSDLMASPYLLMAPPKSTGRELFGKDAAAAIVSAWGSERPEDVIATLTEFTAACVADACERWVLPRTGRHLDRLVVSGGGAHNATLVKAVARLLPSTEVLTQEELGLSSDAKEAVAFAILGNQTLHGLPSNVPAVTGAEKPLVLGSVTYPPQGLDPARDVWARPRTESERK